ncbi:MAG TPA: hypothetical protein VN703_02930 [Candidatus Sulfopaludibacter sp.]|nr:hypothetical protein [Candidatus Sulfopaludibacter sp.]
MKYNPYLWIYVWTTCYILAVLSLLAAIRIKKICRWYKKEIIDHVRKEQEDAEQSDADIEFINNLKIKA